MRIRIENIVKAYLGFMIEKYNNLETLIFYCYLLSLEVQYIQWLSNDGDDTIDNTFALCANCDKKHILDLERIGYT